MSASVHWRTPSMSVTGPRGSVIRQVEYLRKVVGGEVDALITRQHYDLAGRLVTQRDPRLPTPNTATAYALDGQPLKVRSVDAGESLSLPGLDGEPMQSWDARGNHRCMSYDNQMRVVAVEENATPDFETFRYADASADPGHNLCGQMIALKDPSGRVDFRSFALTGQALNETRTFHDGKVFTSSQRFSPLGAMLEHTDAGGHQRQSTYDVAGKLTQVQLQINRQTTGQTVLLDAQYNAAGQIIKQVAGNGVTSHWLYRPADGRLHRQIAQKASGPALQDFEYEYDRVGNITRILDHAYTPTFFSNQRVDGHREFGYDSLSRLIRATGYADAPPSDNPGQPSDPNDRRNYTECYEYDRGDNLIKTTHVRECTCHTREMFIDPASNRGVRWKPGDPPPDFDTLFDRAGNLLALQPGQPMHWNSRGQLETVTLVDRNGNGANDTEYYRYSRGERVYKRHETHTAKISHFHEVRYLPELEIRTKDNGEELHVITLDIGPGGARYLHWEQDPANIGADQLRFTLDDHLGSAVKELDAQAQLISDEGYLPFGDRAFYTTRSAVEVDYKTIRYSGKEMDVSALYDYGARYYAPWLGRWVSADPAGPVDGLNLYAFVGNNPLRYVDNVGTHKEEAAQQQVIDTSNTLSTINSEMKKLNYQLYNLTRTRDIYKTAGKKLLYSVASFAVTFHAGAAGAVVGSGVGSLTGPAAPVAVPVAAAVGGILAAEAAAKVMDKLGDETGLGYTITPDPSGFSVNSIKSKSRAEPFNVSTVAQSFSPENSAGLTKAATETTARVIGKHLKVPYLKQTLAIARQATQLTEALNDSFGQGDLDKITANLDALDTYLDDVEAQVNEAFETLAGAAVSDDRLIGALNMPMTSGDLDRSKLEQDFKVARSGIKQARNLAGRVSAYLIEKRAA